MTDLRFPRRYPGLAVPALAACLLLSACGDTEKDAAPAAESDPALTGALADQIMVDPDLAAQNRGNAAIGGGGPPAAEIPPERVTPEAAAAARTEATAMSGGKLQSAPQAATGAAGAPTAERLAAGALPGGGSCAQKAEYTMAWAARMPAPFPVYPRAHVQEAAGTDRDGCHLRVVTFVTPVAVKDVVDFYFTRARTAGYAADHRTDGKDNVLGGAKGSAAYVVYARKLASGLTEVDLVVNGG